ncbi:MAG: hypothetical protein ACK56F_13610, partial [bacterium]
HPDRSRPVRRRRFRCAGRDAVRRDRRGTGHAAAGGASPRVPRAGRARRHRDPRRAAWRSARAGAGLIRPPPMPDGSRHHAGAPIPAGLVFGRPLTNLRARFRRARAGCRRALRRATCAWTCSGASR